MVRKSTGGTLFDWEEHLPTPPVEVVKGTIVRTEAIFS